MFDCWFGFGASLKPIIKAIPWGFGYLDCVPLVVVEISLSPRVSETANPRIFEFSQLLFVFADDMGLAGSVVVLDAEDVGGLPTFNAFAQTEFILYLTVIFPIPIAFLQSL